MASEILIR